MSMKRSKDEVVLSFFGYIIVIIFAFCAILPFILIISGSFSSNQSIVQQGFSIFPKEFSLQAYETAFKQPKRIFDAYRVSIIVTACGTFMSLLICSMGGFVLSRKHYIYRNKISFFLSLQLFLVED